MSSALVQAPPPAAPAQGRLRLRLPGALLDPLMVGLVALVVYTLHGFQGALSRDLGVFTYGGEQLQHGTPPYVGIFNSVGPLADAIPGLAIWLGHLAGIAPVQSARLFFTVLSAACCALLCVLARDTFGSRAAGLLAPAFFLTFERFIELASSGPREKTAMVVFLLAGLILSGRRRWAAAGVLTALATLTWQPALFVAVAAVVVAVLVGDDRRVRALTRFVLGGAATTAVFVAWFALEGALHQAFEGFVIVNLLYTSQPSAVSNPAWVWRMLWRDYDATLLLFLFGIAALLVLAARALPVVRRSGSVSLTAARLVSLGAGCLAGTVWTALVINGGPDLFVLLPLAALGVAGAVLLLLARLRRRTAVPAVAVLVCAAVAVAGTEAVVSRSDRLVQERREVQAVLGTQPVGATILSVNAPGVLALAGRTNIWPWQLFDPRMERYLAARAPGGLEGLAARLREDRPTFVVLASYIAPPSWLVPILAQDYGKVGTGPAWTWYLASAAGPSALARARAAEQAAAPR